MWVSVIFTLKAGDRLADLVTLRPLQSSGGSKTGGAHWGDEPHSTIWNHSDDSRLTETVIKLTSFDMSIKEDRRAWLGHSGDRFGLAAKTRGERCRRKFADFSWANRGNTLYLETICCYVLVGKSTVVSKNALAGVGRGAIFVNLVFRRHKKEKENSMNSVLLPEQSVADGGSDIDAIDEMRLRTWARQNYCPAAERDENWHPIILDEMRRKDGEA